VWRVSRHHVTPGLQLVSFLSEGTGSLERAYFGTANVYVKSDLPEHPAVVMNEYVCARLAAMIGMPVPVGDVARDAAGALVWASALVALNGQEPAPPDATELLSAEPDLGAGMFVFDTWVGNEDRHDENLIYHPKLGLWLFDHDKTLGGTKTGDVNILNRYRDQPLGFHLFRGIPLSAEHVGAWIQRVRSVPSSAILRSLHQGVALSLYSSAVRDGIMGYLEHRRQQLPQLVTRSLGLKVDAVTDSAAEATVGEEAT
jgi:hypothetical protein